MIRTARLLLPKILLTTLVFAGLSACNMETSNDVYMKGLEIEGQAEREVCRLVYDTGAKAHVLNSGKVKDCLEKNKQALTLYEKAKDMGQSGLDLQYKLEDAQARVKKLEEMYRMVKMIETEQTLTEVGAAPG
jgi:hypothetical protein